MLTLHKKCMNDRPAPGQPYVPTDLEHIANMLTHGFWIIPSLAGFMWMLHISSNKTEYIIAMVYGLSLLALFTVSTVFHMISYLRTKFLFDVFHVGDHAVIYVFIAASHTPWMVLKEMHIGWGWQAVWLVWLLAVMGVTYQYTFHEKYKNLEAVFYIGLGVCPSVAVFAMKDNEGIYEVAVGGAVYILGFIIFKCDGILPFAHAIWHCFVFVGAICHYYAVCTYLLRSSSIPFGYGLGKDEL